MPKGHPRSKKEKEKALELYKRTSVTGVARILGIPRNTVSTWTRNVHKVDWPKMDTPLKWEIVGGKKMSPKSVSGTREAT